MVIALDTTISDSLKVEGYARDIIRAVQDMRKEADYEVSDRISLSISGEGSEAILRDFSLYITRETLSTLSDQMDTPDRMREEPIGEGSLIQIAIKR